MTFWLALAWGGLFLSSVWYVLSGMVAAPVPLRALESIFTMMNLFKFVHAACLPLVLGALCFTGCGDDGYSRAGVDAKDPGEGGSSVQYVLKKK